MRETKEDFYKKGRVRLFVFNKKIFYYKTPQKVKVL